MGRLEMINVTLPWPPSVNQYWRTFRNRMILSAAGREYRKLAVGQVLAQLKTVITLKDKPLRVTIEAWRPDNRRRDLDNLLKAALDALAYAGVYEDDSQIRDLRIYWSEHKGGVLVIKIEVME